MLQMHIFLGELWVNDARIVAWKEEGKALIIALEDYLFKQEVELEVGHDSIDEEFAVNEMKESEDQIPREWGNAPKVYLFVLLNKMLGSIFMFCTF